MSLLTLEDLSGVIYSSGKVFDGLQTGRLATEEFLRTGDTSAINSMHDLALLTDLKQAASLVVNHGRHSVDAEFVLSINASMTRSASIAPGVLREDHENIGVGTPFGRHEPAAVTRSQLDDLITSAAQNTADDRAAAGLFLTIAKAQPFKDGNKRTGIFAANALLLARQTGNVLTVPFSEDDPEIARHFNELLARAYIHNEHVPMLDMLVEEGIKPAPSHVALPSIESAKMRELKAKIAYRASLAASLDTAPSQESDDPDL